MILGDCEVLATPALRQVVRDCTAQLVGDGLRDAVLHSDTRRMCMYVGEQFAATILIESSDMAFLLLYMGAQVRLQLLQDGDIATPVLRQLPPWQAGWIINPELLA